MKVATWNVNGIRARAAEVADWIGREQPDVLCLQEIKASRESVPEYRSLREEIDRMIGRISGRFSTAEWTPVRYLCHGFSRRDLLRKLFETVVARCMKEGIVGGEAFAVDASSIVADAHRRRGVAKIVGLLSGAKISCRDTTPILNNSAAAIPITSQLATGRELCPNPFCC